MGLFHWQLFNLIKLNEMFVSLLFHLHILKLSLQNFAPVLSWRVKEYSHLMTRNGITTNWGILNWIGLRRESRQWNGHSVPPQARSNGAWRRPDVEMFSVLLVLCEGNPPVTGGSPHKGPVTQTLVFSSMCAWTNGLTNSGVAVDSRRHEANLTSL